MVSGITHCSLQLRAVGKGCGLRAVGKIIVDANDNYKNLRSNFCVFQEC